MFKDSKDIKDISSEIGALTPKYNAMTSDYFTIYYQVVPKDNLDAIMKIESARMQDIRFSKDAALAERSVVIEERKSRLDSNPKALLVEEMHSVFYRNDKSWNTIDWENEVINLKSEDALAMHKKYYHPANAVLIVSGDVEIEKIKKLVQKHYALVAEDRRNKSFNIIQKEPVHRSNIAVDMKNEFNTERLFSYYIAAPNIKDESYISTLVTSYILGKSGWGKIQSEIIENLNLAREVRVDYDYVTNRKGILSISVTPIDGGVDLKLISEAINNTIEKMLKDGITASELETAKSLAKFDIALFLDSVNSRSLYSAIAISMGCQFDYFAELTQRISSVTLEQINCSLKNMISEKKVIGYLN